LEQTQKLAQCFADAVKSCGAFVCLYGDIGVGKTAFTRFVLKELGVKERVTSPSFVTLNEYHSGVIPCYHFDLYRLEGCDDKNMREELVQYSNDNVLTFVEWAQFSDITSEFERLEIKISYLDEEAREFEFSAFGQKHQKILVGLKSCIS